MEICFWTDADKKKIDPKLYSVTAEKMAEEFSKNIEVNKPTQIRKFYDEVQRLNTEANKFDFDSEDGQKRWEIVLPMLHMLTAKAVYALGRKPALVSQDFVDFIKDAINKVENPKHLSVFANYFEAFMGFYKYHFSKAEAEAKQKFKRG